MDPDTKMLLDAWRTVLVENDRLKREKQHCCLDQRNEDMKWKNWKFNEWVLEAKDDEVLDTITRDMFSDLYYVVSTKKRYTSLEAAQKAALKARDTKGDSDDF